MRYQDADGTFVCLECGEKLRLGLETNIRMQFHSASGRPTVRVVVADGVEVHRCEVTTEPPRGELSIATR
jgi:hypothetical protein